jgi:hypothetical protein
MRDYCRWELILLLERRMVVEEARLCCAMDDMVPLRLCSRVNSVWRCGNCAACRIEQCLLEGGHIVAQEEGVVAKRVVL